jgi:hypothetical protein
MDPDTLIDAIRVYIDEVADENGLSRVALRRRIVTEMLIREAEEAFDAHGTVVAIVNGALIAHQAKTLRQNAWRRLN